MLKMDTDHWVDRVLSYAFRLETRRAVWNVANTDGEDICESGWRAGKCPKCEPIIYRACYCVWNSTKLFTLDAER